MPNNKKSPIIMKKAYREGLTALYEQALHRAEIPFREIEVHLDSSATITLVRSEDAVKFENISGCILLSDVSKKNRVKIVTAAAMEYLGKNRPTLTDEERELSRKGTSTPMSPERKAELDSRRETKAQLLDMLRRLHGIEPTSIDDEDDESDDSDE